MKKSNIKDIVLAITYRCNSRCLMCNIWQKINQEEFKPSLLKNLPDNIENINLTGGEPFLRADLEGIIKIIVKTCPKAKIIISSNGFATDLIIGRMKEILKFYPKIGIAISLDAVGKKHEEIRGIAGGFNKALKTIKKLKEIGVKNLKIAFTLGDYNLSELAKVYRLAEKLGLEFSLAAVHSSKNYFSQENKLNYNKKVKEVLDWLIRQELKSLNLKKYLRAYFAYGLVKYIKSGRRILPDYSGKLNIFIDPKGDIYPCDTADEKIGDLTAGFNNLKKSKKNYLSWMICTARPAIKKHWLKVGYWILKNKFKLHENFNDK